ncbi:hypothetical protein O6H91_12G060900 [Diphasiastrum complanatum]|uniref:Uncharacterized protein n=1 Tax=Diphasiastrum complanatum TaxID=34168 RepID=A0ACC2C323_DIPCM|nr:hypothetical protein O6H91_12G060900 [Diphasiastrum complanatum]
MICTKTGVQFLYGESYAPETKWPSTAETDQNHMHLKRTGRLRFHLPRASAAAHTHDFTTGWGSCQDSNRDAMRGKMNEEKTHIKL